MENVMPTISLIEKEKISNLSFPREDVLKDPDDIKKREQRLHLGTTLGNLHRNKIKIIFESDQGIMQVETTIWATTEKSIVLKGGVIIPISCIREIKIV